LVKTAQLSGFFVAIIYYVKDVQDGRLYFLNKKRITANAAIPFIERGIPALADRALMVMLRS